MKYFFTIHDALCKIKTNTKCLLNRLAMFFFSPHNYEAIDQAAASCRGGFWVRRTASGKEKKYKSDNNKPPPPPTGPASHASPRNITITVTATATKRHSGSLAFSLARSLAHLRAHSQPLSPASALRSCVGVAYRSELWNEFGGKCFLMLFFSFYLLSFMIALLLIIWRKLGDIFDWRWHYLWRISKPSLTNYLTHHHLSTDAIHPVTDRSSIRWLEYPDRKRPVPTQRQYPVQTRSGRRSGSVVVLVHN